MVGSKAAGAVQGESGLGGKASRRRIAEEGQQVVIAVVCKVYVYAVVLCWFVSQVAGSSKDRSRMKRDKRAPRASQLSSVLYYHYICSLASQYLLQLQRGD